MFKFADKPQTIFEVLTDSLTIYKQTFLRVWYWAVIIPLLSSLPLFLGLSVEKTGFTISQFVLMFAIMLIAAFFMTVLLHRIYCLATIENPNISETINLAKNKWPTVFLAMFITTVLSFIGFMFFIVPGIFLSIMFMFYLPLILFDNTGVVDSIKGSFKLVWGSWWFTFAVIFLPTLIFVLVTSIISLIFGKNVAYWSAIVDIVLVTVFTPFIQSIILVQFNNLKLRQKSTTAISQ